MDIESAHGFQEIALQIVKMRLTMAKMTHSRARLAYSAYEKHTSLLIRMRKWVG